MPGRVPSSSMKSSRNSQARATRSVLPAASLRPAPKASAATALRCSNASLASARSRSSSSASAAALA
eukprot:7255410-Alexandrium_andersonii.AAC.1